MTRSDEGKNGKKILIGPKRAHGREVSSSEDPSPFLGVSLDARGLKDFGRGSKDVGRESNPAQSLTEVATEDVSLQDRATRL